MGCHAFLQGIVPTQGLNPGLPHCRQIFNSESPGKPLIPARCPKIQFNSDTVQGVSFRYYKPSWVGKISWRREWLPTPIFLPGDFCGQKSLAGYSPWDRKEQDMAEQLTLWLSYRLRVQSHKTGTHHTQTSDAISPGLLWSTGGLP